MWYTNGMSTVVNRIGSWLLNSPLVMVALLRNDVRYHFINKYSKKIKGKFQHYTFPEQDFPKPLIPYPGTTFICPEAQS